MNCLPPTSILHQLKREPFTGTEAELGHLPLSELAEQYPVLEKIIDLTNKAADDGLSEEIYLGKLIQFLKQELKKRGHSNIFEDWEDSDCIGCKGFGCCPKSLNRQ